MKNSTISILTLFTVLLLSSCSKENGLFTKTEDKIQGQWQFEKVKFRKNFSITRDDISDEFTETTISFNDDCTMTQTNGTTNQELSGIWKIDTEWLYNGTDQGQTMQVLEGYLADESSDEMFDLDWEYLSVSKKKITATECKEEGTYTYTLVRL